MDDVAGSVEDAIDEAWVHERHSLPAQSVALIDDDQAEGGNNDSFSHRTGLGVSKAVNALKPPRVACRIKYSASFVPCRVNMTKSPSHAVQCTLDR